MANDDAKTRITNKAVKKKSVAEVETRIVKAVKRRADFDVFRDVQRVSVLKRGGLRNSAGEKNQGWILHDALLDEPAVWLSLRGESVGSAMVRIFQIGMSAEFEVLSARGVEGVMRISGSGIVNPLEPLGSAQLHGPRGDFVGRLDASLTEISALDANAKPYFSWRQRGEEAVLQHQYRVLATIVGVDGGAEVRFETHANPLQKFVVSCAAAFYGHSKDEAQRTVDQMDRRYRFTF